MDNHENEIDVPQIYLLCKTYLTNNEKFFVENGFLDPWGEKIKDAILSEWPNIYDLLDIALNAMVWMVAIMVEWGKILYQNF